MPDHNHTDSLTFAVAVFGRSWREQRAGNGTRVPLPQLHRIACRLLDVEPRAHFARSLQIGT